MRLNTSFDNTENFSPNHNRSNPCILSSLSGPIFLIKNRKINFSRQNLLRINSFDHLTFFLFLFLILKIWLSFILRRNIINFSFDSFTLLEISVDHHHNILLIMPLRPLSLLHQFLVLIPVIKWLMHSRINHCKHSLHSQEKRILSILNLIKTTG